MMQDYGDLPPRGFPPLVGEGAWPDSMVDTGAILLLILAIALCYAAYRSGRRYERRQMEFGANRAPEIIFHAIRRQIDIALMATGERAFGPVGRLIETIDAYLGPVLKLSDGKASLGETIHKLKRALSTDKRKVKVEEHSAHGGHSGHGGGSTVIIAGGPTVAGGAVASASASVGGGGVQVVEPARIFELQPQGHGHGHGHNEEFKEVELSARERALAVREALEALSDYWQRERVEGELRAAQQALLITRPIGDKPVIPTRPYRERPVRERPLRDRAVANPVEKAARDANRGIFPLFKF
jgi:hypothetical protein